MIKQNIEQCQEGMTIAKDSYDKDGRILLREGATLTATSLTRFKDMGLKYLYVNDSRTDDIKPVGTLSEVTVTKALKTISEAFKKAGDILNSPKGKAYQLTFLSKDMNTVLDDILSEIQQQEKPIVSMVNISSPETYLVNHSLNVAVYSIVLAIRSGFTGDRLRTVGMGALLHDIGKLKLDKKILNKPTTLTAAEFEEVKKHTTYGYEILKEVPNVPLLTAHCALQHHERANGLGYPRGVKQQDTHEFAQLVSIANSFDSMTSERIYSSALAWSDALEKLYTGADTLYDRNLVTMFRDIVALYPISSLMELTNGLQVVVVDNNSSSPHRPIVRPLKDANGVNIENPQDIDLSKDLSLVVSRLL